MMSERRRSSRGLLKPAAKSSAGSLFVNEAMFAAPEIIRQFTPEPGCLPWISN